MTREEKTQRDADVMGLRIQPYLAEQTLNERHIKGICFTTLSLDKQPATYIRGRKVKATYLDGEGRSTVTKVFTDVYVEGVWVGIDIKFNWIGKYNKIVLNKTEHVKLSLPAQGELKIRRRQRAKAALMAEAESMGKLDLVLALFQALKDDLQLWEQTGDLKLKLTIEALMTQGYTDLTDYVTGTEIPIGVYMIDRLFGLTPA